MLDLSGQTVAIIGAAATGRAAAPVLARRGARVLVYDARAAAELGPAPEELDREGIELRLGTPECTGIEDASLVIPSPGVPADSPVLHAVRSRGIPILAEIEVASLIAVAPIVAVTGTNGKTTTVLMTAAALRAAGWNVVVGGNTLAGGYQMPLIAAADSTPEDGWIVAEVSSFQLESTTRFRPRVAIITNITPDHLNRHGTFVAYAAAKARILHGQGPDDWAILNLDNPAAASLADEVRGRRLWFSRTERRQPGAWVEAVASASSPYPSPLTARDSPPKTPPSRRLMADAGGAGQSFLCNAGDLRVPGEHTIENALAAGLAAVGLGVPADVAGVALAEFPGVADRLEYVATVDAVDFVNNTMCTNVDAAVRSLEAFDRPVVLIAGGMDKGSDFAPLGSAIARHVRHLVVIGEHGDRIAASALAAGHAAIESAESMDDAVRVAAQRALPGDTVLLAPACASFDWFTSFEERGAVFKKSVADLLGHSSRE